VTETINLELLKNDLKRLTVDELEGICVTVSETNIKNFKECKKIKNLCIQEKRRRKGSTEDLTQEKRGSYLEIVTQRILFS
jgi:hypothetical protein